MKIRNLTKKVIALLCAVMFLTVSVAPALQAEAAVTPVKAKVATIHTTSGSGYANTSVNVRKGASIKSKVVVVLKKGDAVKITGNKNGWLKVTATHKGKTYKGYMGAKYVTLKKTTSKFSKMMTAIYNVRAESAGETLRAQEAIRALKAYAKTVTYGKVTTASFTSLAKKWIAKQKDQKAVKAALRENLEAVEGNMSDADATDVLYLQILNGIADAL